MRKAAAGLLAILLAILPINIFAAPLTEVKKITPNKLTIEWSDKRAPNVTIDTFRIDGYNAAQLRALVAACGGTVASVDETYKDGSYQIQTSDNLSVKFDTVKFSKEEEVKVQYNVSLIRDPSGRMITPTAPGWIYLVDSEYNCASLRDILTAMGLDFVFTDDPKAQTTHVILRPTEPTPVPTEYDLLSKPLSMAITEIESVLDDVTYIKDRFDRTVITGTTKNEVQIFYDSFTWIGAYAHSYQQLLSGTKIPKGIDVMYTYIGIGPTLTPTPVATATPTPVPPSEKSVYSFQFKSNLQAYSELGATLGNLGSKINASGRYVIYGITNSDTTFKFNYMLWIAAAGTPLTPFISGKEVKAGSYVEFTYLGTPASQSSVAPSPTPEPTATPRPTPARTGRRTPSPAPTPTLTPEPTPTDRPYPARTGRPTPTPRRQRR
ncbi:MAG: hypothetical protein LBC41_06180 [Clostridiales bacterium]|jgi:hypothetical protein|nr:hypothetical protein [Clostridiales bacterium]